MLKQTHFGFLIHEIADIWVRWKKGDSLSDIGRAVGKHPGSIHHVIAYNGGIAPHSRKRAKKALSLEEREQISRCLASNKTIRQIAFKLNRSPSTICREIERNGGKIAYRALKADNNTWDKSRRPKACYLSKNQVLRDIISDKLSQNWSPEQISGWLKKTYPDDNNMQVSHETIYKSLFIQTKGVLKKSLIEHLRTKRMMRRPKNARIDRIPRGQIKDGVSIKERPPEVEDRAIPGHWEGDLISGSKNTHIATLVERTSRFTMLVKVNGKDATSVCEAIKKKSISLPSLLRLSLTWDRGMELAYHKQLTLDTNIKVYFCDPKSPWQRGTNENTNRLLRQYFPRNTDLSIYDQNKLDQIAQQLNQRPRKTLKFFSPTDRLQKIVAMTV